MADTRSREKGALLVCCGISKKCGFFFLYTDRTISPDQVRQWAAVRLFGLVAKLRYLWRGRARQGPSRSSQCAGGGVHGPCCRGSSGRQGRGTSLFPTEKATRSRDRPRPSGEIPALGDPHKGHPSPDSVGEAVPKDLGSPELGEGPLRGWGLCPRICSVKGQATGFFFNREEQARPERGGVGK